MDPLIQLKKVVSLFLVALVQFFSTSIYLVGASTGYATPVHTPAEIRAPHNLGPNSSPNVSPQHYPALLLLFISVGLLVIFGLLKLRRAKTAPFGNPVVPSFPTQPKPVQLAQVDPDTDQQWRDWAKQEFGEGPEGQIEAALNAAIHALAQGQQDAEVVAATARKGAVDWLTAQVDPDTAQEWLNWAEQEFAGEPGRQIEAAVWGAMVALAQGQRDPEVVAAAARKAAGVPIAPPPRQRDTPQI